MEQIEVTTEVNAKATSYSQMAKNFAELFYLALPVGLHKLLYYTRQTTGTKALWHHRLEQLAQLQQD